MPRLYIIGLSVVCLTAGSAQAQYSNNGSAFVGGILGGILRSMPQQPQPSNAPQPTQPQPQPQPQSGYVQQAAPQPNPQVQQQINEERRQATVEAAEKTKQRQQAEAAARAKQQQAVLKAEADVKAKAVAEEKRNLVAINRIRADPALVAALGPDPRDITVLIVGKDTPTVIRDLNDKPTFQSAPVACFPFGGLASNPGSPEMRFLSGVMVDIAKKGGLPGAAITPRICDSTDIENYDLVIFSSDQVANGSLENLTTVVNAIGSRHFVVFGTFTVTDFEAAEQAKAGAAQAVLAKESADRQSAIDSFQTRDATVISAIYLASPASVVCLMGSNIEGVKYLLGRSDSPFAALADGNSTILPTASANAIFLNLKKHDCFAAIAPAGALKQVVAAFTRDGIPVEVSSGTIDGDKLANWKVLKEQDLLAQQTEQAGSLKAQREADANQKAEDQQKQALEAERQKNDEATRQAKIRDMQKLVASKANAVVDGFSNRLTGYMATVRDEIIANRPTSDQTITKFQPWAGDYATLIKQGWEFQPIRATIKDYGRAQWMKRAIEAISVRVELPMMNRVIGEKKTVCVDFVWINDEEFGLRRNPETISCDGYAATFDVWAQQNNFASQWTLLQ